MEIRFSYRRFPHESAGLMMGEKRTSEWNCLLSSKQLIIKRGSNEHFVGRSKYTSQKVVNRSPTNIWKWSENPVLRIDCSGPLLKFRTFRCSLEVVVLCDKNAKVAKVSLIADRRVLPFFVEVLWTWAILRAEESFYISNRSNIWICMCLRHGSRQKLSWFSSVQWRESKKVYTIFWKKYLFIFRFCPDLVYSEICVIKFMNLPDIWLYQKTMKKCRDPGSNWGPPDLQSDALPTELSRPCLYECDFIQDSFASFPSLLHRNRSLSHSRQTDITSVGFN